MKTYKKTRKKAIEPLKNVNNLVQEKLGFYQSMPSSPEVMAAFWLGIPSPINNDMKLIEATRAGIKKEALVLLSKKMGLDLNALCHILHISPRTFQRLPEDATLDVFSSEQAIEMAIVLAKATQLFQDETAVKQWLHTPIFALNGNTPVSFLDTGFGVKMIIQTLFRLEQGILA